MPVVSRVTNYPFGEKFTEEIRVDAKGTFSIKLPSQAVSVLGYDEIKAPTLNQLKWDYRDTIDKVKAAATSKRKVILYSVRLHMSVVRDGKCVFAEKQISFAEGVAVQFQVGVYDEYTQVIDGKTKYRYENLKVDFPAGAAHGAFELGYRGCPRDKRPESILEWTQEREDFFRRCAASMEAVGLTLAQLYDIDRTVKIIESGQMPEPLQLEVRSTGTGN